MPLSAELTAKLRLLAQSPSLLVASDFDGTLADIVEDPMSARPHRESSVALRSLAELSNTSVAIISGRSLRDLAVLSRFPEEIHLVGSHGSEFDFGFVEDITPRDMENLEIIKQRFGIIAEQDAGVMLEIKPASVALHYRRCRPQSQTKIATMATSQLSDLKNIQLKQGKKVVEALVAPHNKGTALERLRHRLGSDAVVFIGDDVTDEEGFERLTGPDVGIKVGDGDTMAQFNVSDPAQVAEVLGLLAEEREKWMHGEGYPPLEQLSFLSNGKIHAVVSDNARVVWLCQPRPDSDALFAELLGGAAGGVFAVYPQEQDTGATSTEGLASGGSASENLASGAPANPRQRYLGNTMTLETAWDTLAVTDCLLLPDNSDPVGTLQRTISGTGTAVVEFTPRPDFGRSHPQMEVIGDSVLVREGVNVITLYAPGVKWSTTHNEHTDNEQVQNAQVTASKLVKGDKLIGTVELTDGQPVILELRFTKSSRKPAPQEQADRRRKTENHWESWAAKLKLPAVPAPQPGAATADTAAATGATASMDDSLHQILLRSALVLKALCYDDTGAVLAAGTTSLPEEIGGIRNWDYRYCWPRDAAMTVQTLARLGSLQEAVAFLRWLLERLEEEHSPEMLKPLYPVEGSILPPEAVITTLSGYKGSRPVRVGNAASHQSQHDMFGTLLDLMWCLAEPSATADATTDETASVAADFIHSDEMWQLTCGMLGAVERLWSLPDHGIWEERRPPRHHVSSKIMCWVATDRGMRLAKSRAARLAGLPPTEVQPPASESPVPSGATSPVLQIPPLDLAARWQELADRIKADVLAHGWNSNIGAYAATYSTNNLDTSNLDTSNLDTGMLDDKLDASVLMMGLQGMVAPDDERFISTVELVEQRLKLGPAVYRYRQDDGLPGFEGGFFICAFWFVEALYLIGRPADAQKLFDEIITKQGITGLLSEQYDPVGQCNLGNFPQAYSHVGLINAVLRAKQHPRHDT